MILVFGKDLGGKEIIISRRQIERDCWSICASEAPSGVPNPLF